MKLAVVELNGRTQVALVLNEELINLTEALGIQADELPRFLSMDAEAHSLAKRCIDNATSRSPLSGVRIRAPITRPDKLLGIGMNYRSFIEAAKAIGMPIPRQKIWFQRPPSCITGPHDPVWLPKDAVDLDYEGELAVVIGRRCNRVSSRHAPEVIAGYMVANDMTLRTRVPLSLVLAKGFETHTPLGPWIVTPDEVGDPHALTMKTWVNGELRQHSTTAEMITTCYELIEELSAAFPLNPGDIILTGTPAGCGMFNSQQKALCAGDVVRFQIECIGSIENRIVDEPPLQPQGAMATRVGGTMSARNRDADTDAGR